MSEQSLSCQSLNKLGERQIALFECCKIWSLVAALKQTWFSGWFFSDWSIFPEVPVLEFLRVFA